VAGGAIPPSKRSRREEILDESTRLFAERGYEGTSMGDLADRVGLRKASLFHHFTSKEALYDAMIGRIVTELGDLVILSATTPGSYTERLDHMTTSLVTALGEQPFAARILVREMLEWGPFADARFRATMLPVFEAVEQFLLGGQREGVFIERDAKQLVMTMCAIHLLPFALGNVVEAFVGQQPFTAELVEARRTAMLAQMRALVVGK
jgi:AcrR family transcriptional regulator